MKQPGESISCLMDGEIEHARLVECLECLERSPDERLRWQAYQLIADTLKRRLPSFVDPHFSQRIQEALEQEPPLKAPRGLLSRQALGLMVAASLGVVTLLGLYLVLRAPEQKPSLAEAPQVDYLIDHSAYGATGLQGLLSHVRIVGYQPE